MNGDPASHIGRIRQIIITNRIPNDLFYPILHVYVSQFFLITSIDLITLHKIIPLLSGILYVPFIYIFIKTVYSDKNQIILSTIAGCTYVNRSYLSLTPNVLSDLYFPLLLYIILKNHIEKNTNWELLLIIMAFFYPIFHPVPTLAFILILLTLSIPNKFYKIKNINISKIKEVNLLEFKTTTVILLFVWSITWISSFYVWDSTIQNLHVLITEDSSTQISGIIERANYADSQGYNVIVQILKTIGGDIVYILISMISLPIILKHKYNRKLDNLFSLYGPLVSIGLFIIIFYFLNLEFDPLRLTTYLIIISTPFIGFFLNQLINKIKSFAFISESRIQKDNSQIHLCKTNISISSNLIDGFSQIKIKPEHKTIYIFGFLLLTLLLFIVWINGIWTLYPSSYSKQLNYQTTRSEIDGMSWLFENRNLSVEISGMTINPYRFGKLLLTPEQSRVQAPHWNRPNYLDIPYHFGYDNNTMLSTYYCKDIYLGINEKDKKMYREVFPEMQEVRWRPEDFKKLNWDRSIQKIYSNKEFEMFYVNG